MKTFASKVLDVHKPGKSLGLTISDQNFLKYLQKHGLGTLPKEYLTNSFLGKMDSLKDSLDTKAGAMAQEVKKIGHTLGYKKVVSFPYRSQYLPSIDPARTYDRFFLLLENKKELIVSQFNIGSKTGKEPASISVITVKKDSQLAYYHDLFRVRSGGNIHVKSRLDINRRMEDCRSCHKSTFIPIVPDKTFNYKEFYVDLSVANKTMTDFRSSKQAFKNEVEPEPYLGVKDRKKCANLSKEEFLGAQCQHCHNPQNNNALTFPSGLPIQMPGLTSLVEEFVVHNRRMPPWFHDRPKKFATNVYSCIMDDLYGGRGQKGRLIEYLDNEKCFKK